MDSSYEITPDFIIQSFQRFLARFARDILGVELWSRQVEVLEGGLVAESPLYLDWDRAVQRESATRVRALRGQRIELGEALRLEVLHPSDRPMRGTSSDQNNNGVVLRLSYGEVSFLLTADIEAEVEAGLLREYGSLDSTVLKVAHHGSNTSTTPEFLAAVRPRLAIVSVGESNPFGHPSEEVMARLQQGAVDIDVYVTARDGDVEVTSDGERLWVRTER